MKKETEKQKTVAKKPRSVGYYLSVFLFLIAGAWSTWYFLNFPQKKVDETVKYCNSTVSVDVIDTSSKTWKSLPACEEIGFTVKDYQMSDWCNNISWSTQDRIDVERISQYLQDNGDFLKNVHQEGKTLANPYYFPN